MRPPLGFLHWRSRFARTTSLASDLPDLFRAAIVARDLQTLRDISAELAQRGIFNERVQPFSAASINSMVGK